MITVYLKTYDSSLSEEFLLHEECASTNDFVLLFVDNDHYSVHISSLGEHLVESLFIGFLSDVSNLGELGQYLQMTLVEIFFLKKSD